MIALLLALVATVTAEPLPIEEVKTAAAQAAAQALQQGELPEAAFATLAGLLPAAQRQPLREAMDRFDFDRAQALLQPLCTQDTAA